MNAGREKDEDLMRRFQEGDQEAFEHLYNRYKKPVFSFILRQYAGPDAASELTQEVFLRVVRNAESFRYSSKFSTWIFTVARNLAIDALRKSSHRKVMSLNSSASDDAPALGDKLSSPLPTPERVTIGEKLKEKLEEAIGKLPEEQREVFLLREYHGISFSEIAKVVGAKEGTIKSRMRYALESLRADLSDWADYARMLP